MKVNIANSYTAAHPTLTTEIIGSPFGVTIDSDPGKSKIKTFITTHLAGALYTMTIESRDTLGNSLDSTFDIYSVMLTRSDAGGSQQLATTAVYQSAGLYKAELTPTIAGQYTMTARIANAYTTAHPTIPT